MLRLTRRVRMSLQWMPAEEPSLKMGSAKMDFLEHEMVRFDATRKDFLLAVFVRCRLAFCANGEAEGAEIRDTDENDDDENILSGGDGGGDGSPNGYIRFAFRAARRRGDGKGEQESN